MVWVFLSRSPPTSYVEIPILKVMVLEGGSLGRWLHHEGRAFVNGINAFYNRPLKGPLLFLPCEDTKRRFNLEEGPHPTKTAP